MESSSRVIPFQFTGQGGEFFRIWIVNICLTILTLGIYSAWAKVRTNRYIYGSTQLDGASFDYLASPITILKGRLIAFGLIAVYILSQNIYPMVSFGLLLAFIALFPWVLVRSLKFNAINSSYRGVRFDFRGRVSTAYLYFLLYPVLAALTLGIAYPAVIALQKRYFVENSYYGTSQFDSDMTIKAFYGIYLTAFAIVVLTGICFFAFATAAHPFVLMGIIYPIYFMVFVLVQVRTMNLVMNHSQLQGLSFNSHLSIKGMAWIYFTNTLAILASVGLLIPWTIIRTHRYRAAHTELLATQSLDHFAQAEQQSMSATSAEFSDFMDVELGI